MSPGKSAGASSLPDHELIKRSLEFLIEKLSRQVLPSVLESLMVGKVGSPPPVGWHSSVLENFTFLSPEARACDDQT